MSVEQAINRVLQNHPTLKMRIKKSYQRVMCTLFPHQNKVDRVIRLSPNDGFEYFYGYYDKSPWSGDGRFILVMRVDNATLGAASTRPMQICILDTENNYDVITVATSHCWNTQQGCMAQWLGPDFNTNIIFNDYRNGDYCSVVVNAKTGEEEAVLPSAIYDVSHDGSYAMSLDFRRLHTMRPGYGYCNDQDPTRGELVPSGDCLWRIDLANGCSSSVLTYEELLSLQPRDDMKRAKHKVNHIMINPADNRIMFLHRWYLGAVKRSRLITISDDGDSPYVLRDDDFVSHCFWKNESEIISFLNIAHNGRHYYLLKDQSKEFKMLWPRVDFDGHPSFNTQEELVVTDRYPDKFRMQTLYVGTQQELAPVATMFSPLNYDQDVRCDLHPRWDRVGKRICFDATFEGKRALYMYQLS